MFTNPTWWSLILNGLVLLVSVAGFVKIMNNDLLHLKEAVNDIKNSLKEHGIKIDNVVERIAKLEGKFSTKVRGKKK